MTAVAVIPARGGSKRIPRKNVRDFSGRPMLSWSVAAALRSGLFDRVLVSTDDDEVARVALAAGAEVPFRRPASLSSDVASTLDVMEHATQWVNRQYDHVEAVCCVYATSPMLSSEDLSSGLEVLRLGNCEYVFSASESCSSAYRAFRVSKNGGVELLFPAHALTRSQDLPTTFQDAAQFYWGRPHAWLKRLPIFAETSKMVVVPRARVQDIDTESDWIAAERKMTEFLAATRSIHP